MIHFLHVSAQSTYINSGHAQYQNRPIALFIAGDSIYISDPAMNVIHHSLSATNESISSDSIHIKYSDNSFSGYLSDSLIIWDNGLYLGDSMLASEEISFAERPQLTSLYDDYISEQVTFQSSVEGDTIMLTGTLTRPDRPGRFPAVVLVTGSGPQDRNSTIFGHESFRLIADYMSSDETGDGIIVLRYDERGVGESEGDFSIATTETFAQDAESAVRYLRNRKDITIDDKVGLVGHSEGAMIGSILGGRGKTDFQVLVGAPTASMVEILIEQAIALYKEENISENAIYHDSIFRTKWFAYAQTDFNTEDIYTDMMPLLDELYEELDSTDQKNLGPKQRYYLSVAQVLYNPWLVHVLKIDVVEHLNKIETPTFVIFGEKDFQVSPEINLPYAEEGLLHLQDDKKKIKVYPDLNHLMQHSQSGMLSEYMFISETFSEEVLRDIKEWVLSLK